MRADDPRNLADLLGPGNLKQEIEAVNDVGFDLGALVRPQASLRNGKIANFFRREDRPFYSPRVRISLPGDFKEAIKMSLWKHRRLVGLKDGSESVFHLGPAETIFFLQESDAGQRPRPVHFHKEPDLLALQLCFHLHLEIIEAVRDEIDLHGIQLLG